jgi:hypothetical protein
LRIGQLDGSSAEHARIRACLSRSLPDGDSGVRILQALSFRTRKYHVPVKPKNTGQMSHHSFITRRPSLLLPAKPANRGSIRTLRVVKMGLRKYYFNRRTWVCPLTPESDFVEAAGRIIGVSSRFNYRVCSSPTNSKLPR